MTRKEIKEIGSIKDGLTLTGIESDMFWNFELDVPEYPIVKFATTFGDSDIEFVMQYDEEYDCFSTSATEEGVEERMKSDDNLRKLIEEAIEEGTDNRFGESIYNMDKKDDQEEYELYPGSVYSVEVVNSFGSVDRVAEFSYYLPTLKTTLQGLVESGALSNELKDQMEGVKKVILAIEEHTFFPNEDDFGGFSLSYKKIKRTLKKHSFNNFPDPESEYQGVFNWWLYLYDCMVLSLSESDREMLREKSACVSLMGMPMYIVYVFLGMINGQMEWMGSTEFSDHIIEIAKNYIG